MRFVESKSNAQNMNLITPCLPETELDFLDPHLGLALDLKPDFRPNLEFLDVAVFNPAAFFRDLKPLQIRLGQFRLNSVKNQRISAS